MKRPDLLAMIVVLGGVGYLILFLSSLELVFLISAITAFLASYVWGVVSEMWKKIERLEKRIS